MRKLAILVSVVAISLGVAPAQTPERPLTSFPYTPGLDVNAMDKSTEPCVDFYQYSCDGWMTKNPIPADHARWSVYGKLTQDNQRFLWGILEDLANKKNGRNATQQKIGDYFAACMDEAAVEQLGAKPPQPNLARIDAIKSKRDIPKVLAHLHLATGDRDFSSASGRTRISPTPQA